ncbi:MAG: ELM1/GtrOC1 family putative glycosyltransferase [Pseudomonadales bacterium]
MNTVNHSTANSDKTWVVWRIVDGNRGHEKQSQALIEGLALLVSVTTYDVPAIKGGVFHSLYCWISKQYPTVQGLPKPDLIIGTGHKTHASLLIARRCFGGKAVALMRPSLPLSWFDQTIIPSHDRVKDGPSVITSKGVLCPSAAQQADKGSLGLILLGGDSNAFSWNWPDVVAQIQAIVSATECSEWIISDSRRTPGKLEAQLGELTATCIHWRDVDSSWIQATLARCSQVWVSIDSTSMLYESLNSQAEVRVIELAAKKAHNKFMLGINQLEADGHTQTFSQWKDGQELSHGGIPLNDHYRCAKELLEKLG